MNRRIPRPRSHPLAAEIGGLADPSLANPGLAAPGLADVRGRRGGHRLALRPGAEPRDCGPNGPAGRLQIAITHPAQTDLIIWCGDIAAKALTLAPIMG
ncbi:hypothetical protein RPC_1704 [Rhodopseudomonas palustris BisB18]|uniref:Uncharacterized protein n=1 Tax=Rhodopseudomonas palustris (strain BisB18) TaxID=316056 RepID=Q218C3_RHOPB